ncbi:ANTAR domain-containing response regulator [uncultured Thiohalocapsa sp.]|jgi:response regulator NasT|uniref:ANTAR domain-containing response regulator n=1 Tax=uncultured Thiohalocapsa sp. TaxID=768990 RepID=UPI0025F2F762|nr:ANTAR domain-containing protein [uncultured Thiohalocapsa sp.]
MSMRVMLVDPRPTRREVLGPTLAAEGFDIVACVPPDDDLLNAVARHAPDVVLIDIDSPSRDTLENLRSVQARQPRPMVMFTQDDAGESIRQAIEAGVTAYIVDGLENRRVRPIVEAAMARFTQYRALEQELTETRNKLAERKLIERAKGLIMQQQGVSEAEAYQAMRKLAMRRNKKLAEIADSVIAASELMQG